MNKKRFFFWFSFVVVLGLIIWGLVVAMKKVPESSTAGAPPPVTAQDHIRGPDNAPITLIEYSDFQCPACASYYPLVERLLAEAGTTVRLVYRHFPLPQHANAKLASRAAEAAGLQGKFWEMYRLLFENQKVWEALSDSSARRVFTEYAAQLGLDINVFADDLDRPETIAKVESDQRSGINIGVNSTPTFFVNGILIQVPPQYDAFRSIIISSTTPASI